MLRILFVAIVASLFGCNSGSAPTKTPAGGCTDAQLGQTRCSGNLVQSCTASQWTTVIDCAQSSQTCASTGAATAACVPNQTTCTAGDERCTSTTIETCDGTTWAATVDCNGTGQLCRLISGTTNQAECYASPTCTAGQSGDERCTSTTIETCNGSSWSTTLDCSSSGKACRLVSGTTDQAECYACSAAQNGDERCTSATIETCDGTDWAATLDCSGSGKACRLVSGTTDEAECYLSTTCTSGENTYQRCNVAVIETCNGTNWVAGTNCASTSQTCNVTSHVASCTGALPTTCTSAENGHSRCSSTIWQTCNGSTWTNTKDCASTSQLCRIVPALPTVVECYTPTVPSAEFEKCTGSGQGNCTTGLTCKDLAGMGITGVKMCVTDCTSSPSVCAARTCDAMFKWCVDASGTLGDACGLSGVGCGAGLTCEQPTRYADGFACGMDCGYTNINAGATTCPTVPGTSGSIQTECLKGEFVDVELNLAGTDYVACDNGGTADPGLCNQNGHTGYVCQAVDTGLGSTAFYCTRSAGRCGVPVPSTPSFKEADIMDSANTCGMAPLLCKPQGTAVAECDYSGYVGLDLQLNGGTEVSCGDDSACDQTHSYKCKQLSGGKYCTRMCSTASDCDFANGWSCQTLSIGKSCTYSLSYCVDLCDNGESCGGTRQCTQPNVDCNGNATCEASGNSSFFPFPEVQYDVSGSPVDCSTGGNGDCDQTTTPANPFVCMDMSYVGEGSLCARAHKVCTGT